MTKDEQKQFTWAGIIFIIILAVLLWLKLIDTAQAFQITISFILVLITAIYVKRTAEIAKATKEQSEASMKMAEEMRNARSPSITIQWGSADPNSKEISARLKNEGLGTALNPACYLTHKEFVFNIKRSWTTRFGAGDDYPLSLPSENFDFKTWNGLAINCDYTGIFGDKFRSILRCESKENGTLDTTRLNVEIKKLNNGDGSD